MPLSAAFVSPICIVVPLAYIYRATRFNRFILRGEKTECCPQCCNDKGQRRGWIDKKSINPKCPLRINPFYQADCAVLKKIETVSHVFLQEINEVTYGSQIEQ